jgi:hypothetical protein
MGMDHARPAASVSHEHALAGTDLRMAHAAAQACELRVALYEEHGASRKDMR